MVKSAWKSLRPQNEAKTEVTKNFCHSVGDLSLVDTLPVSRRSENAAFAAIILRAFDRFSRPVPVTRWATHREVGTVLAGSGKPPMEAAGRAVAELSVAELLKLQCRVSSLTPWALSRAAELQCKVSSLTLCF